MKNRTLVSFLKRHINSPWGRLVVLLGARQSGKTTLAKHLCPDYTYISFDDPLGRAQLESLSGQDWIKRYPKVILDEVQKAPAVLDMVKAVYDHCADSRLVLLGSSQILLMEKVRESLAGRASLVELYPFTLPELGANGWETPVIPSRLITFLNNPRQDAEYFEGVPALSPLYAHYRHLWERALEIGFMPRLWQEATADQEDIRNWLRNYVKTYLQRDVRDLVMMRDLEPFVLAQHAVAAQTAGLLNVSNLARTASVSPTTAQRFLRYLEISFQTVKLPPWHRNISKRMVKSPKIHLMDVGVMRAILGKWQALDGHEFESTVVVEIFKQVMAARTDLKLHHLRTTDGREIDLLIESEHGYVAIEIKQANHVDTTDARHFRGLSSILDKPLLASLILSNDQLPRQFDESTWALPVVWALAPCT